jgi:hypothetical protein
VISISFFDEVYFRDVKPGSLVWKAADNR